MLDMNVNWVLNLKTPQLNMVLRALHDSLRPEELEEAVQLANSIAQKRVQVTRSKLETVDKLEQNLEEANGQRKS